jgi:hypothetical protein
MATHTLRFTSQTRAFRLTAESTPYAETIDGWTISEIVQPHSKPKLAKDNTLEYYLALEKSVASPNELQVALNEVATIARQLDFAWCYATGRPFHYIKLIMQFNAAPNGWTGNYAELKTTLDREAQSGLALMIKWDHNQWTTSPFLPLKLALEARKAILEATPILRQLIEIHVEAFKNFGQPRFILLAKALEIAGAFYVTGKADKSRKARNFRFQRALRRLGVHKQLTKTIKWLFNMSNTRRDIRHAWDQQTTTSVALHPAMNHEEQTEFVKNADLVLRAFICQRLGIPIVSCDEIL